MFKPPLIADGGEITIMRRTANYVYGSWRVTLPDGAERLTEEEDRNDGYLYQPPGASTGRFDLAFVRMDASITIEHIGEGGETTGSSDVETQMDAGQERSEGRALIERDITQRGVGRLRPGVDFTTGDVWPVKIWGQVIDLPVTALDWTSGEQGRAGWAIRVGGQLISDAEKLRSLNDEVLEQIAAERRKAQEARDKAQEDQIKQAQATAEAAQMAAAAVQEAQDASEQARLTETKATQAQLETILELQQMQAKESWQIGVPGDPNWDFDPEKQSATAKGNWTGEIITVGSYARSDRVSVRVGSESGSGGYTDYTPTFGYKTVPTVEGSRKYSNVGLLLYRKAEEIQRTISKKGAQRVALKSEMTQLDDLTQVINTPSSYYVWAEIHLLHADRGTEYMLQIMRNGKQIATTGVQTRVGPLGPAGNGNRWMDTSVKNLRLDAGDRITFEVWSTGEKDSQREFIPSIFMSWMEAKTDDNG